MVLSLFLTYLATTVLITFLVQIYLFSYKPTFLVFRSKTLYKILFRMIILSKIHNLLSSIKTLSLSGIYKFVIKFHSIALLWLYIQLLLCLWFSILSKNSTNGGLKKSKYKLIWKK
jgi:hypothetical protein